MSHPVHEGNAVFVGRGCWLRRKICCTLIKTDEGETGYSTPQYHSENTPPTAKSPRALSPSPVAQNHVSENFATTLSRLDFCSSHPPRCLNHDGTQNLEVRLSKATLTRPYDLLHSLNFFHIPTKLVGHLLHLPPWNKKSKCWCCLCLHTAHYTTHVRHFVTCEQIIHGFPSSICIR